jgi:hypothetical protein
MRLEDALVEVKRRMKKIFDLDGYRIYPPQYLTNAVIAYLIENRKLPWYYFGYTFKLHYPPEQVIRELEALKEIFLAESRDRHVDIIIGFHRYYPFDPGLDYT